MAAQVTSQLILHPVISQSLRFGNTTVGRDKTYRAIQYFARFIAWYLLARGNKLGAARWNALKTHLGTARKLLRLGKPMEHLQAALHAAFASAPPTEQITTIARQLAYFGYLSADALVWAQSIKFLNLKSTTAQRIARIANRFWLAGILISIAHGITKAGRLTNEAKKLKNTPIGEKSVGADAERQAKLSTLLAARGANREQFTIDVLDVWIPAAALGLVNVNDGLLGLFGLMSSGIAWKKQWQAVNGK
ncbi:peroxisomal biogenesis factor 11 [Fistulina hepatica ATCC 64428]|uniref:Peroxisomal biogenesis factor 11 n=1 Tax=Fistulina hepatica ATCC 64428 TaxID=1128425 RepID=A0A0D7A503_9AGAR|nr:peroxisomal biogenesis factor 11 [Fistulina hepatica ATCC 64428]